MALYKLYMISAIAALVITICIINVSTATSEDEDHAHHGHQHLHEHDELKSDDPADVETEKIDYHKGSLCGYCDYCKFCTLCDRDCPCETGPGKPNCHMCKYCKFCYLCKVCDTVCQPGGIVDRVTASIFNALPSYDKAEVDKDISSVKTWIDQKKDEL